MHYLVTGGCGFIGSYVVRELLALGHQVTVIDDLSTGSRAVLPEQVPFFHADIRDREVLERAMRQAPNGCFHLAAIPSVERCANDWQNTSDVNVIGTIAVFEAAAKVKLPKVVYASSAAVYGLAGDDGRAVHERMPVAPISSYGIDKYANEAYARIAWRNYRLPNVGLRFFNVYGAGQPKHSPYSGVITNFIHAIEDHVPLRIYGDGSQSRDFIYVGDVARVMIEMMSHSGHGAEVFNVCTGRSTTIEELAHLLQGITRRDMPIEFLPARVGDIKHSLGDPTALKQRIALGEFMDLNTGLQQLV